MKNQSLAFSPNFVAEYEQQIKLLLRKIEVDSTGFCDIISQHATTNFIAWRVGQVRDSTRIRTHQFLMQRCCVASWAKAFLVLHHLKQKYKPPSQQFHRPERLYINTGFNRPAESERSKCKLFEKPRRTQPSSYPVSRWWWWLCPVQPQFEFFLHAFISVVLIFPVPWSNH